MPGNLKPLLESSDPNAFVEVQDTAFSIDVLGRYTCSQWDEAVNNGGPPFDAVVIGGGMFGAYCAEKIYRGVNNENLRVLVLDAGSFLISEHVQNMARIGLNAADTRVVSKDEEDPGTQQRVWGYPWRSRTGFPGLAFCLGGRSLYWGGWSPQLTPADLNRWPADVATFLTNEYGRTELEIGVTEQTPTGVLRRTDYINGPLYEQLFKDFKAVVSAGIPAVDGVEDAPLAVQGKAPASGLFSFDKYSSAPILTDAIREAANSPDSSRRLFYVPRAHVTKLRTAGGVVTGIDVRVNGQQRFLSVPSTCAVVLALGTIEATRLALDSFPTPLMGRNLMAHLRSNVTVRIHRRAFSGPLPTKLEAAALLVRGSTAEGRFHLQVTAAAVQSANPEDAMFRMVPDIDLLDRMKSNQNADWITITLRGIGEMAGVRDPARPLDGSWNWMDLSPDQYDTTFNVRRGWVNLVTTGDDAKLWKAMNGATLALALKLAGDDPTNIQYSFKDKKADAAPTWHDNAPKDDPADPDNPVRDGIGTTHHEAGTLWMGDDPKTSVTDLTGRFHHLGNAYVAGPAVFPTIGSANPSLTALTLARRTAHVIVREAVPPVEPGATPLLTGTLADWRMAGSGRFNAVGRNVLEAEGGIGLLWYTKAQFGDFVLRLDWRSFDAADNSGVFVRFPALGGADPANDWRLAADQGYEVQIDEAGYNPDTNATGDALHRTGAIYRFAAAKGAFARPLGQWNTFEINAAGQKFTVTLNGNLVSELTGDGSRALTGHVGLQCHHPGSRVQFRNVRVL